MLTAHELLKDAKLALQSSGRITGDYGSPSNGFCLVGALRWVARGSVLSPRTDKQNVFAYQEALSLLRYALRGKPQNTISAYEDERDSDTYVVWKFNDNGATTDEMVFNLLDGVIEQTAPVAA